MIANNPFVRLPEAASFTVTSANVTDGAAWSPEQFSSSVPGGKDISPQLSWRGAPEGTKSYAVTVYDPDAPTGSGFWHWAVADIPATVTELPEGAGDNTGSGLPEGAFQLPNDARAARFLGAAPPAGHGPHRYFVVVHALDVESIGVPADATPAVLGFTMSGHILGRAVLTATAETPAAEDNTPQVGEDIERIEVSRLIPAPASAIFAVLTDPKGHVDIDASGMLLDAEGERVEEPGDRFLVHMDREALGDFPLGKYDVEVVITKLTPDEEIAWTVEGRIQPHVRHIYGYRLAPAEGGTLVTSYYDWSELDETWKNRLTFPVVPESALKATLGILERTVRRRV